MLYVIRRIGLLTVRNLHIELRLIGCVARQVDSWGEVPQDFPYFFGRCGREASADEPDRALYSLWAGATQGSGGALEF
jgi:hypothetical protein